MARPCGYTTSKVEEWRSIDLANLRRWRTLDPTTIARTGKFPAITWETPNGVDKLGVIAKPRVTAEAALHEMENLSAVRAHLAAFRGRCPHLVGGGQPNNQPLPITAEDL